MDTYDSIVIFNKGSLNLKKNIQGLIECGIHYRIYREDTRIIIKGIFKDSYPEQSKMAEQCIIMCKR